MATNNAVNTSLEDQTGTGKFVGDTNAVLVTPNIGTPSAGVLTNCTGLPVAGGGTGAASFTAYAVLCAGTTSTGAVQNVSGVGTTGQILTSNGAGALPTWQAAASGGFAWTTVSGTTQAAAINSGYVANNAGTFEGYNCLVQLLQDGGEENFYDIFDTYIDRMLEDGATMQPGKYFVYAEPKTLATPVAFELTKNNVVVIPKRNENGYPYDMNGGPAYDFTAGEYILKVTSGTLSDEINFTVGTPPPPPPAKEPVTEMPWIENGKVFFKTAVKTYSAVVQ